MPPPASAKPAVTLNATPTTITAGEFTTLQWTATNATVISFSPNIGSEDAGALPLSGSQPVVLQATTTFTVTVTGPGGTASGSVTVTVNQPPPTVTFSASPTSIIAGQPSTLTWTTQHATSATIDNGVGTAAVPTGTAEVKPASTTTYTITATGPGGPTTATATVTVQAALAITLTADPTSISAGGTSTLSWTSQSAVSVTMDPGIGSNNLSDSLKVSPSVTTTYTATAKDAAGNTTTASATVTVMPAGSLSSIKHIIFLLQENRSFDNYFGQLGGYRASKGLPPEIDGIDLNNLSQYTNFDQLGAPVVPYHLGTVCIENTSPSWNPSHAAYNDGKMDGFVRVLDGGPTINDPQYHRVMGYYDQRDIPYYYELATQFATSDRFFTSLLGPTLPNRMYSFTGTSFGHIYPDTPPQGGWTQKTIFQLLDEHGVSWVYYYQDNSIVLGNFSYWYAPGVQAKVQNIENWYSLLSRPTADDDLPSVVFIQHAAQIDPVTHTSYDEHPGANMQAGVARAQQIIAALINSAAWKSSVFILTHDEGGGLYDHVVPYSVPAPDDILPIASPDFPPPLPGDFTLSGFRIPLIVVSPWVKPNFVSHTHRELTSILKLIQVRFALPSLTRRDAAADDMTEFFDFSKPALLNPPPLPTQPTNGACDWSKTLP